MQPLVDPSQLNNRVIAGRYQIIGPARHTGGFAHIYKAEDKNFRDRHVAVKVIRREFATNEEWRKHFINEGESLADVSGNNVVPVIDKINNDLETNLPFIIMEWIHGNTLAEKIVISKHMNPIERVNIAIGIVSGLQRIQDADLVHGDITPKNIMIRDENTPIIIDFGLSWDISFGIEVEKQHWGTISYIAPELFSEVSNHSKYADIYSLGAVLYYVFTGNHYFPDLKQEEEKYLRSIDTNKHQTVSRGKVLHRFLKLFEDYRVKEITLDKISPKLVAPVNGIIKKCLSKEKGERPSLQQVYKTLVDFRNQLIANKIPVLAAADFQLVIATYSDGLFTDDRLTLKPRQKDGLLCFEANDLYLASDKGICRGVLVHNDQIRFSGDYEIDTQPFRFYVEPDMQTGTISELKIENGQLISARNYTNQDLDLYQVSDTQRLLDLHFIIDGTMSDTEMRDCATIVDYIAGKISQTDYSIMVSYTLYGEYSDYTPMPFHIMNSDELMRFETPISLIKRLKLQLKSNIGFENKGYSAALELALLQTKAWQWRVKSNRVVILIGVSPPHPNKEAYQDYNLKDLMLEEFNTKQYNNGAEIPYWSTIGHNINKSLSLFTIWLRPTDYPMPQNVYGFISNSWKELDDLKRWRNIDSQESLELQVTEILSRITQTTLPHPILTQQIPFPLIKPI